jgi:hypothetical protein
MKTTSAIVSFLALACAASLVVSTARARDRSEFAAGHALDSRVADLEAEIAMLRQQMHGSFQGATADPGCDCVPSYSYGSCDCAPSYGNCGGYAPSCDCCCGPCPQGWYVGGEFVYLQPRWKGFDAYTLTAINFGVGGDTITTVGHDYDYEPSARFWAGYSGCYGLGVRASWWHFEHHANPQAVAVPIDPLRFLFANGVLLGADEGQTLNAAQSLELQTIDLEITNTFSACGGHIVAGYGLRYLKAEVVTNEQTAVTGTATPIFLGQVTENFEGLGPTVSLEFLRPLCFPCWSLYTNLRGTLAFGEQRQDEAVALVGVETNVAARRADEPMAVAELQIALQWCAWGWFARAGWQAQYWDDVASDFGVLGAGGNGVEGSNARSDLGLQGFFIAAGLQY